MRRIAIAVATLLLWPSPSFANGPEIGFDAGTIFPMQSRNVQLVSERVDIDLPKEAYSTDDKVSHNALCRYVLRNLSDSTQTFHMAFVSFPAWSDVESNEQLYKMNSYDVHQDGVPRQVSFYRSRSGEFPAVFDTARALFPTWELTIRPRATSVVEIRYNASWSGGCDGESCGNDFTYYARPAALWAGRIKHAEFHLRIPDKTFLANVQRTSAPWETRISPSGYRWTADGLSWTFTDWEPETDLRMVVGFPSFDMGGDPGWDPWASDSIAAIPKATAGLDRAPEAETDQTCRDMRPIWAQRNDRWPEVVNHYRILVTSQGTVASVRYLDPPSTYVLNDEPEECIRMWRFKPALRAGKAESAWIDVTVRFPAIPAKQ